MANAMESDQYVLMANLDVSMAFIIMDIRAGKPAFNRSCETGLKPVLFDFELTTI